MHKYLGHMQIEESLKIHLKLENKIYKPIKINKKKKKKKKK